MTERPWQIGVCKQVSFYLFPKDGNRCNTMYIVRKVLPNLGSIKSKTKAKLTCRVRSGREELSHIAM